MNSSEKCRKSIQIPILHMQNDVYWFASQKRCDGAFAIRHLPDIEYFEQTLQYADSQITRKSISDDNCCHTTRKQIYLFYLPWHKVTDFFAEIDVDLASECVEKVVCAYISQQCDWPNRIKWHRVNGNASITAKLQITVT